MSTQAPTIILAENSILPFSFRNIPVRGKFLRLTDIAAVCPSLKGRKDETTNLLIDLLTTATILQQDFKSGSTIALQLQNQQSGGVLLARCNNQSELRAYANAAASNQSFQDLQDGGILTVTATHKDTPFQSIIPLEHSTLRKNIEAYFAQSVQAFTMLHSWLHRTEDDKLNCGAIFLQTLPEDKIDEGIDPDDWHRLSLLIDSVTPQEAAPGNITKTEILHRLFHEDVVEIYPETPVHFLSENPRNRMEIALQSLGKDSCMELLKNGKLEMTDAYTGQAETFTEEDLQRIFSTPKVSD